MILPFEQIGRWIGSSRKHVLADCLDTNDPLTILYGSCQHRSRLVKQKQGRSQQLLYKSSIYRQKYRHLGHPSHQSQESLQRQWLRSSECPDRQRRFSTFLRYFLDDWYLSMLHIEDQRIGGCNFQWCQQSLDHRRSDWIQRYVGWTNSRTMSDWY